MLSNQSLSPVGLALTLAVSALPSVGFYPVEFVENGQITIPNLVTINGTGNTGTADLVINDAVLRTHQDTMIFAVDNTGGSDMTVNLYIAKTPIDDLAVAVQTLDAHFAGKFSLAIKAGTKSNFSLRNIAGHYLIDCLAQPSNLSTNNDYKQDWTLYNAIFDGNTFSYTGNGTVGVGYQGDVNDNYAWHSESNGYGAMHHCTVGDKLTFTIDLSQLSKPSGGVMIAFDDDYWQSSAPSNIDTLEYDRGYYVNLMSNNNSISIGAGRSPEFSTALPDSGMFTVDIEIVNTTTIRAIAKIDNSQIADVTNNYVSTQNTGIFWLRIFASSSSAASIPNINFNKV